MAVDDSVKKDILVILFEHYLVRKAVLIQVSDPVKHKSVVQHCKHARAVKFQIYSDFRVIDFPIS